MKVLLCIAVAMAWPLFMWLFAVSIMSFAMWDNYFVIGLGEWSTGARVSFLMLWMGAEFVFLMESLVFDQFGSNS